MHGACFDEPIDRVCLYLRVVQSGETFRLKRKRKLQKRIVSGLIALLIILTPLFTPITVRADVISAPESVVADVTNDTENVTLNGGVAEEDSATPEDSALTDASEENALEENATSEENLAPEDNTSEEETGAENGKEETSESGSETGTEGTSDNSSEESDALHTVTCEKTENAELSVYSSLKESDVEINPIHVRAEEEGLEVLEGYEISGKAETVSEEVSSEDKNETEETTEAIEKVEDEEDVLAEAVEITEKEEATDTEEDSKEESSDDKEKASEETTEEETVDEEKINEENNVDGEIVETEEKLFVKAEVSEEVELTSRETVALYSVENNKAKDVIIEDISLESEPCEIDEDVTGIALVKDTGYRHLNFEIFPEDGVLDKSVILDGLMPKEARAEAVDVTGNEDPVIAAYDITVFDGNNTYQPGDERPINVTIRDERISAMDGIRLWHVKDDGSREEVTDFTVEDGQIRFDATGFSIYEIISPFDERLVADTGELTASATQGFYLYYGEHNYFTNNLNGNNCLIETKNIDNASVWFFETKDGGHILSTKKGDTVYYLKQTAAKENTVELTTDKSKATVLSISKDEGCKFLFKHKSETRYIQHSNSGGGIRFYKDADPVNARILVAYYFPDFDPATLDGKTYGLMNYTGGTHGYALMENSTEGNVHSLVELVTHHMVDEQGNNIASRTLYVDEGSEVTRWNFSYVGEYNYKISTSGENGTKYLAVQNDALIVTENEANATLFKAEFESEGRVQFSYNEKYVSFYLNDTGTGSESGFELSSTSSANSWLNPIDFTTLSDENLITYSADRISVSKKELNGKKVIVYTRIWNEETKRYDIYAVDYNGSLYKCYANGGKIIWLGDGTGSLEWTFTEYYDSVTKEPNYYYELFNSYSEKYLAPQMTGNQVLSENTIGINMPGRKNGEFYSEIVAWDNSRYAYIGLKPNDEKTKLVPCSQSGSVPFYFATLEPLNLSDSLNEIRTLDNEEFGISMKMVDCKDRAAQNVVLGTNNGSVSTRGRKNVLTNSLDATTGYPKATQTGKSLGDLFGSKAIDVNHLFIESVYNSSGYFEFDSCQNFATLCKPDGTLKTSSDGEPIDFTVYRELGSSDDDARTTFKHGQFFPFNIIKADEYCSKNENTFSSMAVYGDAVTGELDESNPRKYEKLHVVDDVNYNNGLELSTSFIQTASGLDAWGHDIVFEFTGDDDFWLYVDDELVIDLGGIHSALAGSVNFKTGVVKVDGFQDRTLREIFENNYRARNPQATDEEVNNYLSEYFTGDEVIFSDYTKHTMKVFYFEHGEGASNLHMRFNLASVTPGHVVISKKVEGEGADLLDTDFLEYPFQIYYKLPDGEHGEAGEEHLLGNNSENVYVTYQNSNQPVTYVQRYRPPGFREDQAYQSIYFINPTKNVEISFPDNTISYRIVECAVDSTVYGDVKINGESVPEERVEIRGELKSYSSGYDTVDLKPSISFENFVNDNVIKDLFITKKLVDENYNEITDDTASFSFRLSISSIEVPAADIPRANMYSYYVLSPNKKVCRFNLATQKFTETSHEYTRAFITELKEHSVDGIEYDDVTFRTSPFGAISGIPAGYTIAVPGLPVGAIFKVTEDNKPGYGLAEPYGYNCVMGDKTLDDGTIIKIPSYLEYDDNPINVGRVIADENPQMLVQNMKGYSLTVNKKWSDLNLTTSHDSVYVAVYVDGELLDGSVKEIKSPSTSAYYFWPSLKKKDDGSEREDLTGYAVKEVTLTGSEISVAEDGTVTGYTSVAPLQAGDSIELTATRTKEATPEGQYREKEYTYVVSYQEGVSDGSTRTDTVSNTREDGIAIRLFKWNSTDALKGGHFTLTDETGTVIGNYVSDSDGLVTLMYEFDRDKLYTLTETSAPDGYVGLQKKCKFKVNPDNTISLYYEDDTEWGTKDIKDTNWVKYHPGANGIDAFVDVYNKQFNFKIEKTDKDNTTKALRGAHFALYKQVNATVSGYIKNKDPLTGFENFETDSNGVVFVCGGDSGRVIKPGEKGAVFFLTETKAPTGYDKLEEDIVFRVSPLGVPSIISDGYNGQLVEEEDCYVYTLSVPNEKNLQGLAVTKTVTGNMGNKSKEFNFTFEVVQLPDGRKDTEFTWSKNGKAQTNPIKSGNKFTLAHEDDVVINVPAGTEVTITENIPVVEGYTTSFKLDGATPERTLTKTFTVGNNGTILEVINDRETLIPTGVAMPVGMLVLAALIAFGGIFTTIMRQKKMKEWL